MRIGRICEAIGRWFDRTEDSNNMNTLSLFAKFRKDRVEPHNSDDHCIPTDHLDVTDVEDSKYLNWLKEHPSALTVFQEIMNAANGKQIVVFLDYDGTLTPIVDDPEKAFMSPAMRSAVRDVAKKFSTAIISGRSRDKVYGFVKLEELYYAGSHGMDIKGPVTQSMSYECKYQTKALDHQGNELTIFQPAQDFLPSIKELLNRLKKETCDIEGVFIEDNRFCLSVHYRHVPENDYAALEKIIKSVLEEYPKFRMNFGKKVMELKPSIEWNKGNAVLYLLDTLGYANSSDVFPIFIGDDKTDEDAFKVIRSSKQGCPILVSSIPRDTRALSSLQDPTEVESFLIRLANWVPAGTQ
ncbi:OLC1v1027775C1 [Oldenlandia corymbosa var. corymbosa]|uniref:Trehalose 6-phosphate phosphatase n=1 Tax=Oldenlandia corymbosa var. corymbosa TaxID=529605 RepID=A0AAV1CA94_OLDCO|nr:OLC1v1027775C1 [Oldenlandia corymbosa var. corymbosa]